MRRHVTYAVALAALLLVGAGCAARQQSTASLEQGAAPVKTETKTDLKPEATVDGTVDSILKDAETETSAQKERSSAAADVDADDPELKAFSDNTYDLE